MPTETRLVIRTLFSPDDDTQAEAVRFVAGTERRLRIAIYGFHLPPMRDEIIALYRAGKDVALVLDHTQAEGRAEHSDVQALLDAGVPLRIGTSPHHRIMHHKFAVRDGRFVLAGSWNFSLSASDESNWFDIVESPERAALFEAKWQELWDWISANEPQYQGVSA